MILIKWWPVLLLLSLFPIAYFLNPDGVITPALRFKGFDGLSIFILSGGAGTIEMFLWYLGWGGVSDLIKEWAKDDINFAKKVAGQMKRDGYLDWFKIYIARKHQKLTEKASTLWKGLKAGSYLAFFGIGCWPTPGPRVVADFLCGTTKNRPCFVALCLGNLLKTAAYIFAWNWLFSFFGY